MLLLLAACSDPAGESPDDGFLGADDVRLLSPVNGDVLAPTFDVAYEAGRDVAYVRFFAGAIARGAADAPEAGTGTFTVSLEDGRYNASLVGYDEAGEQISHHPLTIRVEGGADEWVTLLSPVDGATAPNPVSFVVDASDGVDTIELYADAHRLGEAKAGGMVSFTLEEGAQVIDAVGLQAGVEVARDTIALTVEAGTKPDPSDWNARVLDTLATYPTDGSYGYYWPQDDGVWYGTTRDVWYRDELMSPGDPQHRSFCVGLTWELLLRVFDEVDASTGGDGTFNGMTVADMVEFRTDWFVRDLYGDGVVTAVTNYGIGERVTDLADVRPGDFLQFWRHSGSGHNNVFIEWAYDGDGAIEGVTYWSTQSSTDGVGYNTEYFGSSGSSIDPSYFFAARVYMPDRWVAWE